MAIISNSYYPKQMNGTVISAFGMARDDEYSDADTIIEYLYNLSIDTADETDLENIGIIIGYPRPLVPEGFNDENILLLGDLPLSTDEFIGLSNIIGSIGGELSTTQKSVTGYMALGTYRKLLKSVGIIKRYGITLNAIDQIAYTVTDKYEISWNESGDIILHFTTPISYKNVWILTQLFYRMATMPQIIISSNPINDNETESNITEITE